MKFGCNVAVLVRRQDILLTGKKRAKHLEIGGTPQLEVGPLGVSVDSNHSRAGTPQLAVDPQRVSMDSKTIFSLINSERDGVCGKKTLTKVLSGLIIQLRNHQSKKRTGSLKKKNSTKLRREWKILLLRNQ